MGKVIFARVAGAQMPNQRPDGIFAAGVKDNNMGNTDQMPVYLEDHHKGILGLKESYERRCITTGGKEHSRFTSQLTIFKNGRKVSE